MGFRQPETSAEVSVIVIGIDRITVNVGQKFDPENQRHIDKVIKAVAAQHGEGFEIENFEPATGKAVLRRENRSAIASHTGNASIEVPLPTGTTERDGKKRSLAFADAYPGYVMTTFEPHRRRAILSKLEEDIVLTRDALATALRCEPWDIQVSYRPKGGYDFTLPSTYRPSAHDKALTEVTETIIGKPGWYFETDTRERTGSIIPAELPTFKAVYPTPLPKKVEPFNPDKDDHFHIPIGTALPEPGKKHTEQIIDISAHQHVQIGGIAQAGKSTVVNAYITQFLARGAQLAIIDTPDKAVDFAWCKDFVMPGGWGCENIFESATVTKLIEKEKTRRSAIIARNGVQNWTQLPPDQRVMPLLLVIDEVTVLFSMEPVPKTNKDSPQVLLDMKDEAESNNLAKEILQKGINDIAAEMRFAGIFLALSTQVASTDTGLRTKLRSNLGHKVLLGANPTDGNRRLIFNDPEGVPRVPSHIREDPVAARGTGSIEPQGSNPAVFKGYYRSTDEYRKWLISMGIKQNADIRPTVGQVTEVFGDADIDLSSPMDPSPADVAPSAEAAPTFVSSAGSRAQAQHDALLGD